MEAFHKIQLEEFHEYIRTEAGLKCLIIGAVDIVWLVEMENYMMGFVNMITHKVLQHLEDQSDKLCYLNTEMLKNECDEPCSITEHPNQLINEFNILMSYYTKMPFPFFLKAFPTSWLDS